MCNDVSEQLTSDLVAWDYAVHMMIKHMTNEDMQLYGGNRWLLGQAIFEVDDGAGSFSRPDREILRSRLTGVRWYIEERQGRSAEEIVQDVVDQARRDGIADPEATRQFLATYERIFMANLQPAQTALLLASLPLGDDPVEFGAIKAMTAPRHSSGDHDTDVVGDGRAAEERAITPETADPHWFGLEHVLRLAQNLQANEMAVQMLQHLNKWLTDPKRKVGKLTMHGVVVVGCVWRKNIRSNRGEVPINAITAFCTRIRGIIPNDRPPHHLQIKAAKDILYAVGFMRLRTAHDHATSQCAAYELLNEALWA